MILDLQSPHRKSELVLSDGSKVVVIHILGSAEEYPKRECNRNVFRVAKEGIILWRVAFQDPAESLNPFVGVNLDGNGKIMAFTWEGWRFEINAEDGSLKNLGWSK